MAQCIPQPLCVSSVGRDWIDQGTLARSRSPVPGVAGRVSLETNRSLSLHPDLPHRLLRGARAGLPFFGEEIREIVAPLLTLENLVFLCAAIAAEAVFVGTGIGAVITVVMGGAMVVFVGAEAFKGTKSLLEFYRLADSASSDQDYEKAGAEFAEGVTALGVATFVILLTRRAGREMRGRVTSREAQVEGETLSVEEVIASWRAYISKLDLRVPRGRGALWSKMTEYNPTEFSKLLNETIADGDVATRIAAQDGRFTLESKLPKQFWERYKSEFTVNGKLVWDERTEAVWRMLSERYAEGLEGNVIAYIDSDEVIDAVRRDQAPILTKSEIKIIKDQVAKNGKITSVIFEDIWTKRRTTELSRQVISKWDFRN
jgi:hypothetical protein